MLATLTFTPADWDTPQTVTITGADDTLIDGDIPYVVQVAVDAVNTLDANFASLPAQDVSATNADDDMAGFTLSTATLIHHRSRWHGHFHGRAWMLNRAADVVFTIIQQRYHRRHTRRVHADIHA
jgi:hypothetical protein